MFNCRQCHEPLPQDAGDFVKCTVCDQGLHFGCSVAESTWRKYGKAVKNTWRCVECRGGSGSGTTNEEKVSAEEVGTGGNGTAITKQMMQEMFQKFSKSIEDKLSEFQRSVQYNSDLMDEFNKTFTDMKKSFDSIQTRQDILEKENVELKRLVREMKIQMMESEQKFLGKNLEINGIPEMITEPQKIMDVLCKRADLNPIKGNEFKLERAKTGNPSKTKAVLIKFESEITRDAILKQCKARRLKLADFTGKTGDIQPVYVNAQLTPMNKKLFFEANILRKENKFEFLWFQDNKILMKKDKNSKVIPIYSKEDIK